MNAAEFQAIEPAFERYNTPDNWAALGRAVAAWSNDHYTNGEANTYRIVFNQLKDKLIKPNQNYREPISQAFRDLVERQLSPTELRLKIERDPV